MRHETPLAPRYLARWLCAAYAGGARTRRAVSRASPPHTMRRAPLRRGVCPLGETKLFGFMCRVGGARPSPCCSAASAPSATE
jgi:hypothetical protein